MTKTSVSDCLSHTDLSVSQIWLANSTINQMCIIYNIHPGISVCILDSKAVCCFRMFQLYSFLQEVTTTEMEDFSIKRK